MRKISCSKKEDILPNLTNQLMRYRNIIIWGAASGGAHLLAELENRNCKANITFLDNDNNKTGKLFCGRPIYCSQSITDFDAEETIVAITCSAVDSVKRQLSSLFSGEIIVLDYAWVDPNCSYRVFVREHKYELEDSINKLADSASKDAFEAVINYRLTHNPKELLSIALPSEDVYFAKDIFLLSQRETIVDGGAYNGDTIFQYRRRIGKFKRLYAFEPDPENLKLLKCNLQGFDLSDRVRIIPKAIGADEQEVLLDTHSKNGFSSSFVSNSGNIRIEQVSLDEELKNERISFLKLDIEGSEIDALKGSTKTIGRCRPIMAICAYHRYEDLFMIPQTLAQIYPEHDLFFRHYSKTAFESVFYAVPREYQ